MSERPAEFDRAVVAEMPMLRRFALRHCFGNVARAEDMVQEALTRALLYWDKFEPGTNLGAWLLTIARNHDHTVLRRTTRREVSDPDGEIARRLATSATQQTGMEVRELLELVDNLQPEQREVALRLAGGASYEETALELGLTEGTVKSKMSRVREILRSAG